MTLVLEILVALSLAELCVVNRWTWRFHRPLAAGLAILLAILSGVILGDRPSLATGLVAIISVYRVVNLMRLVKGRTQEVYLVHSVRRTSFILSLLQAAVLTCVAVADARHLALLPWLQVSSALLLVLIGGLFISTRRQLRKTEPLQVSEHFSDSHLPSLSVCIPARNETVALERCLQSLVANDYPKLEIIVLDDCSQGGRTSDIIRAFAHDGVRFIQGESTPKDWVAKNWAYEQLTRAASGELVLFCGVDIRFGPSALRTTVTTLLAKDKRMLSLIPTNSVPTERSERASLALQPVRYAWELCLPRRMMRRPAVLSSCWVAERKLVRQSGGFSAVRTAITPEAFFARKATSNDGYSFTQSVTDEVISTKARADQWATAVRTRYPQLHRRLELVFMVSLLELLVAVGSPALLVVGLLLGDWLLSFSAGISAVITGLIYGQVVSLTYRRPQSLGYWLAPVALLVDIYVRHESAWRYEFGEITWKGRNVCLPVMRVIPKFPKL